MKSKRFYCRGRNGYFWGRSCQVVRSPGKRDMAIIQIVSDKRGKRPPISIAGKTEDLKKLTLHIYRLLCRERKVV